MCPTPAPILTSDGSPRHRVLPAREAPPGWRYMVYALGLTGLLGWRHDVMPQESHLQHLPIPKMTYKTLYDDPLRVNRR